jgi:hypothetical protein
MGAVDPGPVVTKEGSPRTILGLLRSVTISVVLTFAWLTVFFLLVRLVVFAQTLGAHPTVPHC